LSETFEKILDLVHRGQILISDHGYDELVEDDILVREIVAGIDEAELVENYPDYPKGASVLVLQKDLKGNPIHLVWGIPRGAPAPAVVVTAYRPDPQLWSKDFLRRIS